LPTDASQSGPQPAEQGLYVGHWPHLRGEDTVGRIMWSVAAALVPAAVAAGYFFGIRAHLHIGLAVATAVITEAVITHLRLGKMSIGDGSAVVTGLLVAFCLPAQARWFVPIVASAVAIGIAKHCFGGLGYNIWNPALVGRAFVHISFPTDMNPSVYPVLRSGHFLDNIGTALHENLPVGVEAWTGPSPMKVLKELTYEQVTVDRIRETLQEHLPSLWQMFAGNIGGNLGETSALLLLIGAVFLIIKGWVRWQIPLAYLATVAVGASHHHGRARPRGTVRCVSPVGRRADPRRPLHGHGHGDHADHQPRDAHLRRGVRPADDPDPPLWRLPGGGVLLDPADEHGGAVD